MNTLHNLILSLHRPDFMGWLRDEFAITAFPQTIDSIILNEISGSHSHWLGHLVINDLPGFVIKLMPVNSGYSELLFHQQLRAAPVRVRDRIPVAPVLHSGLLVAFQAGFVLMHDQSKSHHLACGAQDTFTGFQVSEQQQKTVLRTLARYHGYGTGLVKAMAALGLGRYRNDDLPLLESIPRCTGLLEQLAKVPLPAGVLVRLHGLLPKAVHYWNTQLRLRQDLTLCHGDCFLHHFWLANQPRGRALLFDFGNATVHSPVWDLVTLLSTGNFADVNQCLNLYHQYQQGSQSLKSLREEFQMLALCQIWTVLAERERGAGELIWRTQLRNLLRFCDSVASVEASLLV